MRAYVLITVRTGEIRQVLRQLRGVQGVLEANMTFGPYDAVSVVEASSISELGNMISSEIQPIPGVMQTLTCLAVDDKHPGG
jgi:DNA-binding Lrp family transcriptional regulator